MNLYLKGENRDYLDRLSTPTALKEVLMLKLRNITLEAYTRRESINIFNASEYMKDHIYAPRRKMCRHDGSSQLSYIHNLNSCKIKLGIPIDRVPTSE